MRLPIVLAAAAVLALPSAGLAQSQSPAPEPSAAASGAPSAPSSPAASGTPAAPAPASPSAEPGAAPGATSAPSAAPASASPPSAAPSAAPRKQTITTKAARAARDATRAAKNLTYQLVGAKGARGSVALYAIGRTRTRVVVTVPGGTAQRITLHRGSDCTGARSGSQADVALAPLGAAIAANAPQSETVVDIPLEQLQSGNYSVAIANATQRAQFAEACARLRRR